MYSNLTQKKSEIDKIIGILKKGIMNYELIQMILFGTDPN